MHKNIACAVALCVALTAGLAGLAANQPANAQAATIGKVTISAKTTSATVKWSKVKKATKYRVAFKKATAKKWTFRWTKKRSITLSKLSSNTTYRVRVKAFKGKKLLRASTFKRFTTKAQFGQILHPTSKKTTGALQVIKDTKFNGIYADITIADFDALGFAPGDSVDVTFSNGFTLEDLPYYDGYYVRGGSWLVVGYPGYPYIKICKNNDSTSWESAGVVEGSTTVTITLNTTGKYSVEQETFAQKYTDERDDLPSGTHYDEVFANFRSFATGNLKEGVLYRSASPCDEVHNRPVYVDKLIAKAQVKYILDLADSAEDVASYVAADGFAERCPYFMSLYESGAFMGINMNGQVLDAHSGLLGETTSKDNCSMLDLGMDFRSLVTRQAVADGLRALSTKDGPYLIHCTEGKDRTGFVCFLLEALAASSYDEMVSDYMITYDNYYGIRKDTTRAKYDALVNLRFDEFVQILCGDDVTASEVTPEQFETGAEAYLVSGGMTGEEIEALKKAICK